MLICDEVWIHHGSEHTSSWVVLAFCPSIIGNMSTLYGVQQTATESLESMTELRILEAGFWVCFIDAKGLAQSFSGVHEVAAFCIDKDENPVLFCPKCNTLATNRKDSGQVFGLDPNQNPSFSLNIALCSMMPLSDKNKIDACPFSSTQIFMGQTASQNDASRWVIQTPPHSKFWPILTSGHHGCSHCFRCGPGELFCPWGQMVRRPNEALTPAVLLGLAGTKIWSRICWIPTDTKDLHCKIQETKKTSVWRLNKLHLISVWAEHLANAGECFPDLSLNCVLLQFLCFQGLNRIGDV